MSDDEGYNIVGVIEVVGVITLIFVIMGVFSDGTFLQPSTLLESIIMMFITIGGTIGLIYAIAKGAEPPPAAAAQPAPMATSAVTPAKGPAAYVKCPNCGSDELIEVENSRIMMPYEDAEHNYVAISEVNYATCAKCGAMIGTLPTDNTHTKAPVPGVKYQTCEVCGSSEFMMSIFTKIRMTADKIEDLSETHGPILCLKCGHDLSQPLDDMAPTLAVVASAASD